MSQPQRLGPALGPLSDAALMNHAAQGDVAAFAQIYDRHAATVLALVRHVAKRTSGEEDVLQEVFLEAWLSACDYDPERASVRVWLLVRARSRALDRHRQRVRETSAQRELALSARPILPQTERQIAVGQALSTLDPGVRSVLELTFFEGMTAAEVADTLKVPEGTAKSRLARGLVLMERVLFRLEEGSRDESR